MGSLPSNISVEIEAILLVRDRARSVEVESR
jgi:hypothetical protein